MGWNDRDERIAVFEDTKNMCNQNARLRNSIQRAIEAQRLIREEDDIEGAFEGAFDGGVFDKNEKIDKGLNAAASEDKEFASAYDSDASIVVSKKRTFEAASAYARNQKVCVLNFASATNPGGGVKKGSSAQEECLCRCSTLYPCISDYAVRHGFHDRHKTMLSAGKLNALYNDDCIYTPEVTVFKPDTSTPRTMPEQEWYKVDVITCAAPNLRARPSNSMNPASGSEAIKISNADLMALQEKRPDPHHALEE
ncbi:MAG: TIGR02452 family protein, partial [Lachnospiraceae bacterium]|nr:TIGR02452 family protein [Lachnospiraceae bacterium]